jgi:hypothetical protein
LEVILAQGLPDVNVQGKAVFSVGLTFKEKYSPARDVGSISYQSTSQKEGIIAKDGIKEFTGLRLVHGDTLGIYIDKRKVENKDVISCQMSRNGENFGPRQDVGIEALYPTLYARTSGLTFEVNFGQKPFKFRPR